jgi:hypothetical protein
VCRMCCISTTCLLVRKGFIIAPLSSGSSIIVVGIDTSYQWAVRHPERLTMWSSESEVGKNAEPEREQFL